MSDDPSEDDAPDFEAALRHQHLAARAVIVFFFLTLAVPGVGALSGLGRFRLEGISPTVVAVFLVSLAAVVFARPLGRRAARKRQRRTPTEPPRLRAAEMDATTRIVGGAAIIAGAHANLLAAMGLRAWLPWILGLAVGLAALRFWRAGSGMPLDAGS